MDAAAPDDWLYNGAPVDAAPTPAAAPVAQSLLPSAPAPATGGDISGGYHISKAPPPLPQESDESLLARAGIAEGGASVEGQTAVIRAIKQRAAVSGKPISELLTQPGQMQTYWNGTLQGVDPNSPAYQSALKIAQTATPSPGIDSWYSPAGIKKQGYGKPPFDPSTGTMIGGQMFGHGAGWGPAAQSPGTDDASWGKFTASIAGPQPTTPAGQTPGADPHFTFGPTMGTGTKAAAATFEKIAATRGWKNGAPPDGAGWGSYAAPIYVPPGAGVQQTPGFHWVDADGNEHVNPGGALEKAGSAMQGALFGLGDVGASLTRMTGGVFGVGTPQQALQTVNEAGNRYALQHYGDPYAQAGRFVGQAIPATLAAGAVPELEAPAALGGVGKLAAQGVTNALRGVAATAPSVGANSAPVSQQLATGALAGVALPAALGLAGKGATATATALTPRSAENATADKVAGVIQRALVRDGVDPSAAAAEAIANPNRPAFHAGGPNVVGVADAAAQSPGAAQATVRDAVAQHQGQASDQVRADIGQALGGRGDYLDALDQAISSRRDAANRTMGAIENQPVKLTSDAVLALRSDLARGAISSAAQNALASTDPTVRASGADLNRIATQVLDNPSAVQLNIRNAQDISKSLLDAADAAYRGGDGARGGALKTLGRSVRDAAAGSNDAYKGWLSQYGSDSDNLDALKLGHNAFSSAQGNTAPAVRAQLADMGPQAQAYYTKGVAEALIDQSRLARGGVGTMRQLLRTQDISDKVRLAFPDDASFNSFLNTAQQRVSEQDVNASVRGGSQTYSRQAARADLENQPFHPLDLVPHAMEIGANTLTGNVGALAGKALKAALNALPRTDRSVVGNPQTNALLGLGLTDPTTFAALATRSPRAAPVANAIQNVGKLTKPISVPLSALAGVHLPGPLGNVLGQGTRAAAPVGANAQ